MISKVIASVLFVLFVLLVGTLTAFAGQKTVTVTGGQAVALAVNMVDLGVSVTLHDKKTLDSLLYGDVSGKSHCGTPLSPSHLIVLKAQSINCTQGNVAIGYFRCIKNKSIKPLFGRAAHEVVATLHEFGVQGEGAAGTTYYEADSVSCTVDPNEVKSCDGGGASCTLTYSVIE